MLSGESFYPSQTSKSGQLTDNRLLFLWKGGIKCGSSLWSLWSPINGLSRECCILQQHFCLSCSLIITNYIIVWEHSSGICGRRLCHFWTISPRPIKPYPSCPKQSLTTGQQITTARHSTDNAAKPLTTSIAFGSRAWLRTGLSPDACFTIEDLPFNKFGLFSGKKWMMNWDHEVKLRTRSKRVDVPLKPGSCSQYHSRSFQSSTNCKSSVYKSFYYTASPPQDLPRTPESQSLLPKGKKNPPLIPTTESDYPTPFEGDFSCFY